MTDQQIINGLKSGDESAFRSFVDSYQEMVINVSNRFVHNKEDALDIAQEVFIKVYISISAFKANSKLSTWIYRITVNQSLNFIRDKKRKNIFSSLDLLFENHHHDAHFLNQADQDTSPEKIEKEENKQILLKTIEQLPKKQKIAFTLNKLEDLPYKEVAEIMGITVTETGVLINRARKKLQQKLGVYFKKY